MSREPKKKQDLSVEEILKSIKGVIDNRDNLIQASDDDILELTNIVAHEEILDNSLHEPLQSEIEEAISTKLAEKTLRPPLVSDKSAAETSKIFHNFSETAKEVTANATSPKVKTLEDLIIEMVRPELSQWLDKNLPSLVKELVEKEIQRLIPNN
jgi:hypothetical protein